MNNDPQGAADEQARQEWEDGDGATVATSSGIWHAALAYERARLSKLCPPPSDRPTPRTDDELARLLRDPDMTNIDRREAMAEFSRKLEVELARLCESIAGVCRTNSDNADAMIAQIHDIENLRRQLTAREADLQAVLQEVADLRERATKPNPPPPSPGA